MCGRYTLSTPKKKVIEVFQIRKLFEDESGSLPFPRYNIAPSQQVAVVLRTQDHSDRQLGWFQWGLIPSWTTDPTIGHRMINARAETAAIKPAFRSAMRYRRCLIPADGFYEWQKDGKHKQPYHIRMQDGRLFAFAALWEHWPSPNGNAIDSCTILTTDANELVRPIHDRMPVILEPTDYDRWLDPSMREPQGLEPLLRPCDPQNMTAIPVSNLVNSPTNESSDCMKPVEP